MFLVQTLNSVKFHSLAVFICHLLMGGKFQSVQVLFDPGTFDSNLFRDIQSNCLNKISWMAIDITQPEAPKWEQTVPPDNLIQLIFIGLSDVESEVRRLSYQYPNYYRLFIFHPNGNDSFVPKTSNKLILNSNSNTIGIFYDAQGEIKVRLLHDDSMLFHQVIDLEDLNDRMTSPEKLFDRVFGEREKMRKLAIYDSGNAICKKLRHLYDFIDSYSHFMKSCLYKYMNVDFVEIGQCTPMFGRRIPHQIYNELFWDIERISNEIEE